MIRLATVAVVAIALILGLGSSDPGEASHPWPAPNYLWGNLEAGGTQRVTYSICAGSLPSTVSQGIEVKWDAILPQWEFVPSGVCDGLGVTSLDWERARGSCQNPDAVACLINIENTPHGNHSDIVKVNVFFDTNGPYPFATWDQLADRD
jgi:hypothetical protein